MSFLNKHVFKEVSVILSLSVMVAFFVNFLSPNGIAMVGQWETSKGVVTAKKKTAEFEAIKEIESVLDAYGIFKEKSALFVDARDIESFREGHIKGAVSFPVNDYESHIADFLERYKPEEKVVVYCSGRLCDDSHTLSEFLFEEGYRNISVFIDGIEGWEEKRLPMEFE